MIGPISYCPQQLHTELLRASFCCLDVETTGLARTASTLSVGVRVNGTNYVLFTERCTHASIKKRWSRSEIAEALAPLAEQHIVVAGWNLPFDINHVSRVGVRVARPIDGLACLRLLDQDRGQEFDDSIQKRRTSHRWDLQAPGGLREMNYKLKDTGSQLLAIKPVYTPSPTMESVDRMTHAKYLAHDLFVTEQLYKFIWPKLSPQQQHWYWRVLAPLLHDLIPSMTATGVQADVNFIDAELARLAELMDRISDQHRDQHGAELSTMLDWSLRKLIYRQYGLPVIKGPQWKGSVEEKTLRRLIDCAPNPTMAESLQLIHGYRLLKSRCDNLQSYRRHIQDGRIHTSFTVAQSTGRMSSSNPNLQSLAKAKVILDDTPFEVRVFSRNVLRAADGNLLVAADIEQADVRVLAHMIGTCRMDTDTLRQTLLEQRRAKLWPHIATYEAKRKSYFNKAWQGQSPTATPTFDPNSPSQLVADFQQPGDFYNRVASNIVGRQITQVERSIYKTILIAQINGQTTIGLKKQLRCTLDEAQQFLANFYDRYPDVQGYIAHLKMQVAITGQTHLWSGRTRTITAHHWMTTEPRVRILLTYADGNRYWFDAIPLSPHLRFLTCYVLRIWSAKENQVARKIYDHQSGRIGTRRYKQVDDASMYNLPIRNLPWSNIRRVQRLDAQGNPAEEARYEGFDTTARVAINAVMQGGTADISYKMMLRTKHLARHFGAKLLLNIHDELLWECPADRLDGFVDRLRDSLQQPPAPGFAVPIRVGIKAGHSFGQMETIEESSRRCQCICSLLRPARRRVRRLCARVRAFFI